ncbi:MAG: hypothetical protein Q9170_003667 [Blastenia crenularia]
MGYQPIIDSYESWTGSDWTSRREVLAWGAGAELRVRVKWMGPRIEKEWQSISDGEPSLREFDQHHHRSKWWRVSSGSYRDGRDDITAVKLLRDHQKLSNHCEYIVVGRASGKLEMISINSQHPGVWKKEARFSTDGHNIRSASVSSAAQPLLAACVDDRTIAIYIISSDQDLVSPLGRIQINSSENSCRIWSTIFLRQDRLAVGLGPSVEPVQVFEIRPDAIPSRPIRSFAIHENCPQGYPTKGTIYPIAPLPRTSSTNALHDLRSLAPYTASFTDLVDHFSAIYSLLPLGHERFLAGGSNHALLKVFDLRKAVDDLCCCSSSEHTSPDNDCAAITDPNSNELESDRKDPRNWNVFLTDKGPYAGKRSDVQRISASPVYSLSMPSPYSPTIFAGVEDQVIQLDITSVYDQYPDPVYKFGDNSPGGEKRDAIRKWDPNHEVMCLATYEQVKGPVTLRQQAVIGELGDELPGWDERWRHI